MRASGTDGSRRGQAGQALTELAIMLPVLLVVLAAAAQFGYAGLVRLKLQTIVRAAAREAALHSGADAVRAVGRIRPAVLRACAPDLDSARLSIEIGRGEAGAVPAGALSGGPAGVLGGGAAAIGFPVTVRYVVPAFPLFARLFRREGIPVSARLWFYGGDWSFGGEAFRRWAEAEEASEARVP